MSIIIFCGGLFLGFTLGAITIALLSVSNCRPPCPEQEAPFCQMTPHHEG
jgi:hypothetical protein